MKKTLLKIIKEQKEAEEAKEKLDAIPWFEEFILDVGSKIKNSSLQMDVEQVDGGEFLKVTFTGEPHHLLALTDSLLSIAKPMPKIMRKKSEEGFFTSNLVIIIDLFNYKI